MSDSIRMTNDKVTASEKPRFALPVNFGKTGWHLVWWVLVILHEQLLFFGSAAQFYPADLFYFYACNIAMFYLQLFILRFTLKPNMQQWGKAIFLTALAFAAVSLVKLAGDYLLIVPRHPEISTGEILFAYFKLDLFRTSSFAGLGAFYWMATRISDFRRMTLQAEVDRMTAERKKAAVEEQLIRTHNAFLQQRLNPHLLLNTLGFVHSTVIPHSVEGATCLEHLSEILRYCLQSADADSKVALAEELKQLENLIAINKFRFGEKFHFSFQLVGTPGTWKIAPLFLLTLAENIFKHGRTDLPDIPAKICISIDGEGMLSMTTSNAIRRSASFTGAQSALGLESLLTRLEYLYPGDFELNVKEHDLQYDCQLNIRL